MKHRWMFLLLPAVAAGLTAALFPDIPLAADEPATVTHADVHFGIHTYEDDEGETHAHDLRMDVVTPRGEGAARPAVLVLHGGGWIRGDKHDVLPICNLLAQEGFVAAAPSYRLARPSVRGFGPSNPHPWPAQIEDAKAAVRYLRASAERWGIDPQRIAAMGFSAGGHLAMLLGTMDPEDGLEGDAGHAGHSSKVQAVVSFFGPTWMGRAPPKDPREIPRLPDAQKADALRAMALASVFGSRFLEDPTRASPLRYVDGRDAAMLLFQGTRDTLVEPDHTMRMMDALTEARIPGKVVFHVGTGHGRGWRKDPVATDAMRDVLEFLDQRFRPARVQSLADRLK